MKKVLFVSAIMCMTMAAFVACNKNDGNNPGGDGGNGNGGSGSCSCTYTYMGQSYTQTENLANYPGYNCTTLSNALEYASQQVGTPMTVNCR